MKIKFTKNSELLGSILLVIVFVSIGTLLAFYNGLRAIALVSTVVTFIILISTYCLLSVEQIVFFIRKKFDLTPQLLWLMIILFSFTYLIYSLGNKSFTFTGLGKLILFLSLPTAVIFFQDRNKENKITWQDFLAILLIWLPFDFRLLSGIWVGKVIYAFNVLVAFSLAIILFIVYRRVEDVGYNFRLDKKILYQGLINFILFAPLAIGIGLMTGFLIWAPSNRNFLPVFLTALGIFLFTALPEELLFRGLMQNLLAKALKNNNLALIIASIVFGLAHLNNAPYPKNIIYCFLATIAGIFYGRAYFATKSILASAITHALVDTVWHELFK
ncbi:MAG: CPBP family intramembrane metalloprotease [Acidobacteria bacterium]|nr:CPBP family intramembrane metalloprotease [Acidobacteriota bacterium]